MINFLVHVKTIKYAAYNLINIIYIFFKENKFYELFKSIYTNSMPFLFLLIHTHTSVYFEKRAIA